jgi:hypothetical protein
VNSTSHGGLTFNAAGKPNSGKERSPRREVDARSSYWEYVMALATGTKLGPYEILSAIGTGGMGESSAAPEDNLFAV